MLKANPDTTKRSRTLSDHPMTTGYIEKRELYSKLIHLEKIKNETEYTLVLQAMEKLLERIQEYEKRKYPMKDH